MNGAASLQALIKNLRQARGQVPETISQALLEIKQELQSADPSVKTNALLKLTYLTMHGCDAEMGLPVMLELVGTGKFELKKVAYFCASLLLSGGHELTILMTNLFKKELVTRKFASGPYELGAALSCLVCINTVEISTSVITDLLPLFSSSKPYIRKKAYIASLSVLKQHPQAWSELFPMLKAGLTDSDQSVLTSVVSILTEISFINAKLLLPLIPGLFHLLSNSQNNWMTIKLLKIFANLPPVEPRVVPKVVPVLTDLLVSTKARSVELELLRLASVFGDSAALASKEKLQNLLSSTDKNLKLLALEILPKFPHAAEISGVLAAAEDSDPSVRDAALHALKLFVTAANFQEISAALLETAKRPCLAGAGAFAEAILDLAECCELKDPENFLLMLVELAQLRLHAARATACMRKISDRIPEYSQQVLATLLASDHVEDLPQELVATAASVVGNSKKFPTLQPRLLQLASLADKFPSSTRCVCLWAAMQLSDTEIASCGSLIFRSTDSTALNALGRVFLDDPGFYLAKRHFPRPAANARGERLAQPEFAGPLIALPPEADFQGVFSRDELAIGTFSLLTEDERKRQSREDELPKKPELLKLLKSIKTF